MKLQNNQSILICGSLAYDSIMTFPGRFSDQIFTEQLHQLNVAFVAPEMRVELGGCAGNIAWNLHCLGGNPTIMATAGCDFERYRQKLDKANISTSCIAIIEDVYTAQGFITTDLDNNQITVFHPGAMSFSDQIDVAGAGDIELAIVGPDSRGSMIKHLQQCREAGIEAIFDPGQAMPLFNGDELLAMSINASYLAVNDYEAKLFQQKTKTSIEEISKQMKAVIVTHGDKGSSILIDNKTINIPSVKADQVVDPTGCGDAYRAGLLYGIAHSFDWQSTGKLASLLGSIKVASKGGQNHSFDYDNIADRFKQEFGYCL